MEEGNLNERERFLSWENVSRPLVDDPHAPPTVDAATMKHVVPIRVQRKDMRDIGSPTPVLPGRHLCDAPRPHRKLTFSLPSYR